MDILVKHPKNCSPKELELFEELVRHGGEVPQSGLKKRILQAENLIFIYEQSCIAVGAIKNPVAHYKDSVFKKANTNKSIEYQYELGWLFVDSSVRGYGHGRTLMQTVTNTLSGNSCFATTRENNTVMHHLFSEFGFVRSGNRYKSDNGDYNLSLYLKSK